MSADEVQEYWIFSTLLQYQIRHCSKREGRGWEGGGVSYIALHTAAEDGIGCRPPDRAKRRDPAPSVVVMLDADGLSQVLLAIPHPQRVIS